MGYGGPRVAFYTANHYSNYANAIQHEDSARVRSIIERREWPAVQAAQRQREEDFRAYERAQAAEAARLQAEEDAALERRRLRDERAQRRIAAKSTDHSVTATELAARRARHAHLCRLAKPRAAPEPAYGVGMLGGTVPHQSGRHGKLPTVGRNGAVYSAGVDRHRIVPARPDMQGTIPPWMGSYSTHHGPRERDAAVARAEAAYYCSQPGPRRTESDMQARQKTLHDLAAEHSAAADAAAAASRAGAAAASAADSVAAMDRQAHPTPPGADDDDVASVFSHGSSNGPIAATGNAHMSTLSTKDTVRRHLDLYGGAMTAPRVPHVAQKLGPEEMTLPALTYRLVRMQSPLPRV